MITQAQIAENRRRAIEFAKKRASENMRLLTDNELEKGTRTGKMPIPQAIYGNAVAIIECRAADAITGHDLHALWLENGKCSRMKLKEMLGGRSHSETAAHFLQRRVRNLFEEWPTWVYDTACQRRPLANGIDPKIIAQEFAGGASKPYLCKKYKVNGTVINQLLTLAEKGLPNDGRHIESL